MLKLKDLYFENKLSLIVFSILFIALLVTRIYQPEVLSGFGFDQVDNAWAVKNIVVEHKFPLVGMQAKGNTGFYIGPYYYYFLVPFYVLTGMDPIASQIAALFVAVFTFLVIYFVVRSIFNEKVALIALFINVFSSYILGLDRVQWPVNFIVPISFLFFFSLYKVCNKEYKYFLLLSASFGFSLHIHFTSIFYLPFFVLMLPLIRINKKSVKYIGLSVLILLFFLLPILVNYVSSNSASKASNYLGQSFHGFHLRRFLQIVGDGFIEFNAILNIPYSLFISILSFVIFIVLMLKKKIKKNIVVIFMSVFWILIPWIAFSTYSGEITNYYFGIGRPVVIIIFSYLIYRILFQKNLFMRIVVCVLLLVYAVYNVKTFLDTRPNGLSVQRQAVLEKISKGEKVEFVHGDPKSYLYFYYYDIKGKR